MEYPRRITLSEKLSELDKVQSQVVKGMITIREALNQRIRIMTECSIILQDMLRYDLGEEPLRNSDTREEQAIEF